jgi:hypothetical protein
LKIKLKNRHFDRIEAKEAESQAMLKILTEHDFQDARKEWQKFWERRIYAWRWTISEVMFASRPKVSF